MEIEITSNSKLLITEEELPEVIQAKSQKMPTIDEYNNHQETSNSAERQFFNKSDIYFFSNTPLVIF